MSELNLYVRRNLGIDVEGTGKIIPQATIKSETTVIKRNNLKL